jgi:hypothetical protein
MTGPAEQDPPAWQTHLCTAIPGLVTLAMILIFELLGGLGCAPAEPQGAVELEAGAALDLILPLYHTAPGPHPGVFGVPSDCSDFHDGAVGYGFWLDGACRGGLTTDQRVYLVLHPQGTRASYNLAHEARHWAAGEGLIGGDLDPGHTSPTFFPDVAAGVAALRASDLDVLQVGPGGFAREASAQ